MGIGLFSQVTSGKRKLPQAAPEDAQIRYLEKFLHGKVCQTLNRLPRKVVLTLHCLCRYLKDV